MEENKYYTPDIEDIRVGYKYELAHSFEKTPNIERYFNWNKYTFKDGILLSVMESYIKGKMLRTAYLTKEQIEAEGWKLVFNFSSGKIDFELGNVWLDKDAAFLSWDSIKHTVKITTIDEGHNQDGPNNSVKYNGYCPSINEFRYITKLINNR